MTALHDLGSSSVVMSRFLCLFRRFHPSAAGVAVVAGSPSTCLMDVESSKVVSQHSTEDASAFCWSDDGSSIWVGKTCLCIIASFRLLLSVYLYRL